MTAEEYIKLHTRGCSNEGDWRVNTFDKEIRYYHRWLTPDDARSAVKIAKEETIEKACKWLEEHLWEYDQYSCIQIDVDDLVRDLKQTMED